MAAHIKSCVTNSNNPHWQDIFTALTLGITDTSDADCFYKICGIICPQDDFAKLQEHLFGGPDHGIMLNINDYLLRLYGVLTNPDQSGELYTNRRRYAGLAKRLLNILTDSDERLAVTFFPCQYVVGLDTMLQPSTWGNVL